MDGIEHYRHMASVAPLCKGIDVLAGQESPPWLAAWVGPG